MIDCLWQGKEEYKESLGEFPVGDGQDLEGKGRIHGEGSGMC